MPDSRDDTASHADRARFETTRWNIVLTAGGPDTPAAREARETLCATYWYPLYAFVRRKGYGSADAEDLVQGFFARLLDGDRLSGLDPRKGTLRAFLMAACKNYLAGCRDHDNALKRAGGRSLVQFDSLQADIRYTAEPCHAVTAERLYDRHWALTLIQRAGARLREEMRREGKVEIYDRLSSSLAGEAEAPRYATIARELGKTEGALKMAAARLRARFGQILREEIAATVSDPDQVDDEVADLFNALAG
jgi:RNA polymerase sigma-70 factor (ECF subfamily)